MSDVKEKSDKIVLYFVLYTEYGVFKYCIMQELPRDYKVTTIEFLLL